MIKGSENVETRRNMLLMLACIVSKEDFPEDGGTTLRVILESISEDNPDPVSQWCEFLFPQSDTKRIDSLP